jgi:hypothetical protein
MRRSSGFLLAAMLIVSACGGSSATGVTGQGTGAYSLACGSTETPVTGFVWCGWARASVKYGDKTYGLASGQCQPESTLGFIANFGAILSGAQDLPGAPLGLSVSKATDGATVSGRFDGHTWAIKNSETTVTLSGMSGGSFSGPTFDGIQVEGTFTCLPGI